MLYTFDQTDKRKRPDSNTFNFVSEVRIETSNSTNTCDSEFMLTEFISNAVFFPQKMVYLVWWNTSQDLNKGLITVELEGKFTP